jgi:transcriptional regulator with XRE-family HTH domain
MSNPVVDLIFEIKKRLNLTDTQMAIRLDMSVIAFNKIKNCVSLPNLVTFSKLCNEFGISKDRLFDMITELSKTQMNRKIH